MLLIKYQADFLVNPPAPEETWDVGRKETETEWRKTMKGEFISQTVTYGSLMKKLINVIQIPINGGNYI